ncbi:chaperone modulator CbpM [Shinella sp.]|uniref:chaperone modulator CbpM n=1 Tax=Shinella sp. TaxID=1870904 RepID=UPI0028AF71A6|nr:chaperone modulator CbpM [Shinella sp.]
MMRVDEIIEQIADLQQSDLDAWISEALISPQEDAGALVFSEVECARIRLICTLRYDLEVDEDTLPIIVSLLDQLHQARQRLFKLSAAVATQDKLVQAAILNAIERQTKTD